MRKTFKYRLFPTATQQELLRVQLSEACRLYNAALQERRDAYQTHKKSLNYYDQANQLKEIRASGDLSLANYHCCQDVLKRIDKAFKAFFRRCKSGQKPGFPRFKSHRRYDSITFPSHGDGNKLLNRHLRVQGVGDIKVKLEALAQSRSVRCTNSQRHREPAERFSAQVVSRNRECKRLHSRRGFEYQWSCQRNAGEIGG
jgi:putative transposase